MSGPIKDVPLLMAIGAAEYASTVIAFETIADYEASGEPPQIAWIVETQAFYSLVESTATVNHVSVLSVDGDDAARGILVGAVVHYTPKNLPGDAANCQTFMDANGVTELVVEAGTAVWDTEFYLRSNKRFTGSPDLTINATLEQSAGTTPYPAPFRVSDPIADGTPTTLASNATQGSRTISTVGPIDVGKTIIYGSETDNKVTQAEVTASSGTGPFTLTLSNIVPFDVASGKDVFPLVLPTNIQLDGRGMLVTGTGKNAVELPKVKGGEIKNFTVRGAFTGIVVSADLACDDVWLRNVTSDANGASQVAGSFESTIGGGAEKCYYLNTIGGTGEGLLLSSPVGLTLRNVVSENHTVHGAVITGTKLGLVIDSCQFNACSAAGIAVEGSGITIANTTCASNAHGIRILGGDLVVVTGCQLFGRPTGGSVGLLVSSGSVSVSATATASNVYGIEVDAGSAEITGHVSQDTLAALAVGAAKVTTGAFNWTAGGAGWAGALTGLSPGCDLSLLGGNITMTGVAATSGVLVTAAGDLVYLTSVRMVGGTNGLDATTGAASIRMGFNVKTIGTTTPSTAGATAITTAAVAALNG